MQCSVFSNLIAKSKQTRVKAVAFVTWKMFAAQYLASTGTSPQARGRPMAAQQGPARYHLDHHHHYHDYDHRHLHHYPHKHHSSSKATLRALYHHSHGYHDGHQHNIGHHYHLFHGLSARSNLVSCPTWQSQYSTIINYLWWLGQTRRRPRRASVLTLPGIIIIIIIGIIIITLLLIINIIIILSFALLIEPPPAPSTWAPLTFFSGPPAVRGRS